MRVSRACVRACAARAVWRCSRKKAHIQIFTTRTAMMLDSTAMKLCQRRTGAGQSVRQSVWSAVPRCACIRDRQELSTVARPGLWHALASR